MKLKIEKEEYINKTFRLNKKLVNKMDLVCDKKGISLNRLVDICLNFALEHLDENGDECNGHK
jgi:predicted HicB family RNase H-like nuclease